MKILWITNILFPEAEGILNGHEGKHGSGGWMYSAAENLASYRDCELLVATVSDKVRDLTSIQGIKIRYFVLPKGRGNHHINNDYIQYFRSIQEQEHPDIVHIHGTECSHGLAYIEACGSTNLVLSIQGLTSAVGYYYLTGLDIKEIFQNYTLRDFVRGGMVRQRKSFLKRSKYERIMIEKASNIIGRTSWDKARVLEINPRANYFFCNETLRETFYSGKWTYQSCCKHRIFLSLSNYPIKGLHLFIEALAIIKKCYPDVQVHIAGDDFTRSESIRQKLSLSGYGRIIKGRIEKNCLENSIMFMGKLSAEEMKREYLEANVFVCPSTIENSPNSLGEAQLLGVPCVASYVGGIPDMVPNEHCGTLYRAEEISMLAMTVIEQLEVSGKFDNSKEIEVASLRHSRDINAEQLINIYKKLTNQE